MMQEAGFSRDKGLEEMNDSSGVSVIGCILANAFAHIPIKLASSWRVRTTDALCSGCCICPEALFQVLSVTFRRSMESPFWLVLLPNLGTINFTFSSLHQVLDGYFVHYFAPKDLPPYPRTWCLCLMLCFHGGNQTPLRWVWATFSSFTLYVEDSDILQWTGFNWCEMSALPFICSCLREHSWTDSGEATGHELSFQHGGFRRAEGCRNTWNKELWIMSEIRIQWGGHWRAPLWTTILFSDGIHYAQENKVIGSPWPVVRNQRLDSHNSDPW